MNESIVFQLNGERAEYGGSATARLLDVLRDDFALTGVKCGCKEGECGACSVLLDGKLVNSCMVAMGRIAGASDDPLVGLLLAAGTHGLIRFRSGAATSGHRRDRGR